MRHLLLGLILLTVTAPPVAASDAGAAPPAPTTTAGAPAAPAPSPTAAPEPAVSVVAIEAQIRQLDGGLRQLVAQREQAQRQLDASERAITETLAVIGGLQAALRLQAAARDQ